MSSLHLPLSRVLLALFLVVALSADVAASPSSTTSRQPQTTAIHAAWFDFVPVNGRPTRTTVIRIAAVGMVLALFIMYRNKH